MAKKKHKKLIIAALTFLVVGAISAFALYTSHSYQKAVVATSREEIPFSSNYLKLKDNTVIIDYDSVSPIMSPDLEAEYVTFPITINNFPLGKINQTAQSIISYDMKFIIDNKTGNYEKYSIRRESTDTSVSVTKNCKDLANESDGSLVVAFAGENIPTGKNTDTYYITMPTAELGNVIIKASAVPNESISLETVSNKILQAALSPRRETNTAVFGYEGRFTDRSGDNSPSDYAAYNYSVSITTGTAKVTLVWNPKYVDLDPSFKKLVGGQAGNKGELNTWEFTMDYDSLDTYNMIFYKTGSSEDGWNSSWEELEKHIYVYAEQAI